MRDLNDSISLRGVLACCAATLVAYVGIVHEVVGTTLYPEGPAAFGGPFGWHAVGLLGVAAGLLLSVGVLRWLPVPVVPLAATVGVIGAAVFIRDAVWHGGFHLFAFTLVIACAVLVLTEKRNRHTMNARFEATK